LSRDYTLLAKLGFQDQDKGSPIHDAACRYLAQIEVAQKLVPWAAKARTEFPISKGTGAYKTTIGFMDVALFSSEPIPWHSVAWEVADQLLPSAGACVEVKVSQTSIPDAIRQLSLYREHCGQTFTMCGKQGMRYTGTPFTAWILATTFDINQDEKASLEQAQIIHVKLGAGFQEFLNRPVQASVPDFDL